MTGLLHAIGDRIARAQAGAGFRRWATGFPLTRPVARRRAASLFDLCAGFVYSQVLLAVVQLRLVDRLRDGPLTAAALQLDLPPASAQRLLAAAAALRLLAARGTAPCGQPLYGLGPLGAALVDNPGVAAMVEHHAALYEDLRDPLALLRGQGPGALAACWPYRDAHPAAAARWSALMAASQSMVADQVLHAYRFTRHRAVLDVGGGTGAFLRALGARAPHLRRILFDLPPVATLARDSLPGVTVVPGSFLHDALPRGADLVTLIRVLHDHDDAEAAILLRACHAALPPGGRILIGEPMAGTPGAEASGDGYFGLYLLAMGQGRPRTPRQIKAMLRAAGFVRPRLRRTHTPLVARVITAESPSIAVSG